MLFQESLPPGLVLEKWRSGTMLSVNTPAVTSRAFAEGLARIALAKNTGPDPHHLALSLNPRPPKPRRPPVRPLFSSPKGRQEALWVPSVKARDSDVDARLPPG